MDLPHTTSSRCPDIPESNAMLLSNWNDPVTLEISFVLIVAFNDKPLPAAEISDAGTTWQVVAQRSASIRRALLHPGSFDSSRE